ncbi:MAG: hypothetical protein ACRC3I_00760 [Cetobacterium sp.]
MNVLVNSNVFFMVFFIIPLFSILLIIIDNDNEREILLDKILLEKVNTGFKDFEQKKLVLSKKDSIEYHNLKMQKIKYLKKIKSPFTKLIIFLTLVILLIASLVGHQNCKKNDDHLLNKNKKELIALRSFYNRMVIIGVLSQTDFLKKLFFLTQKISKLSIKDKTQKVNKTQSSKNKNINDLENVVYNFETCTNFNLVGKFI